MESGRSTRNGWRMLRKEGQHGGPRGQTSRTQYQGKGGRTRRLKKTKLYFRKKTNTARETRTRTKLQLNPAPQKTKKIEKTTHYNRLGGRPNLGKAAVSKQVNGTYNGSQYPFS